MSAVRHLKPGYVITYPNREKTSSQVTKVLTAAVLVLSAVVILLMTFGGWSKMEGLIPLDIIWCLVYLVMAWYVIKWARGLLPMAAALGALMLTCAVIALTGYTGVAWSDRSGSGYTAIHSIFGGTGFSAGTMNLLVVIVAITQIALIVIALQAFGQGWNIEYEIPAEEAHAKGHRGHIL
jgi:hypothetical protein